MSLLIISNCNTVENIRNEPLDNAWLKGKIVNWSEGEDKIIRLDRMHTVNKNYGSSRISSDGYFSITPIIPPDNDLEEIVYLETYLDPSAVYVSNTNAKGIAVFLEITTEDLENVQGYVMETKSDGEPVGIFYMYADSEIKILGTKQYISIKNDTLVIVYDLHYKKGWNRKASLTSEVRQTPGKNEFRKILYTTDIPNNSVWIFKEN